MENGLTTNTVALPSEGECEMRRINRIPAHSPTVSPIFGGLRFRPASFLQPCDDLISVSSNERDDVVDVGTPSFSCRDD